MAYRSTIHVDKLQYNYHMTPATLQIITLVALALVIVLIMRFVQPKLPIREQLLLKIIQSKSPQLDNIRLFMFIKMVVRPVEQESDLNFQKRYLDDASSFKSICDQFKDFGAKALFPLLSFEALNWNLEQGEANPLVSRLGASQVCCCFPHTAEIIEDLLIASPDETTAKFVSKSKNDLPDINVLRQRYRVNIQNILQVIVMTKRNEWWPGTNPDIREWAENLLAKYYEMTFESD
jgi:hypothetical protein